MTVEKRLSMHHSEVPRSLTPHQHDNGKVNYTYDNKYGWIITQHGKFHKGEGTVLFRFRDRYLPKVMGYYRQLILQDADENSEFHLQVCEETMMDVEDWQTHNEELVVTPTSRGYKERVGEDWSNPQ